MSVRLMSHIPDDLILRQIKHEINSHGELHNSQIGSQVPAGPADLSDQKVPYLLSQYIQFFPRQFFYILRAID